MNEERKKYLVIIVIVSVLAVIAGFIYKWKTDKNEKAKVVYPEKLQNTETIQKRLNIDKGNAESFHRAIQTAQPNVTYYITSPSVESAAEETAERINKNDESLPRLATEKTDRTVVTPNTEKQKVDVYKINLNKAHKIKVGAMTTGDKTYIGAGYQYGRWEGMLYTRTGRRVEAAAVTYTIAEW